MAGDSVTRSTRPVPRSELVVDLRDLGVRPGSVLMVHTRMSAIGWVVGAAETVVRPLLDSVGPDGTLLAYLGWNDSTAGMDRWPSNWQDAYRAEAPPFDPGLVFVIALVAEIVVSVSIPLNQNDSAAKIARELDAHSSTLVVLVCLSIVYAVAFLIYLWRLHEPFDQGVEGTSRLRPSYWSAASFS